MKAPKIGQRVDKSWAGTQCVVESVRQWGERTMVEISLFGGVYEWGKDVRPINY